MMSDISFLITYDCVRIYTPDAPLRDPDVKRTDQKFPLEALRDRLGPIITM